MVCVKSSWLIGQGGWGSFHHPCWSHTIIQQRLPGQILAVITLKEGTLAKINSLFLWKCFSSYLKSIASQTILTLLFITKKKKKRNRKEVLTIPYLICSTIKIVCAIWFCFPCEKLAGELRKKPRVCFLSKMRWSDFNSSLSKPHLPYTEIHVF